jgi:hypothetical protein
VEPGDGARLAVSSLIAAAPLAWIEGTATVVAALGTVGAVVLALWLQVYRAWRRKPSLTMSYSADPNSGCWAPVYREGHQALWLRFSVSNATGKDTARDVQVLVTRVETPSERRELVPGGPLHWTDLRSPTVDLPAGISRMIDIAQVELPADTQKGTALWLKVSPVPGDTRHRLEPGSYDVELAVTAQGIDADFSTAKLDFEDVREDDPRELVKHLRVARFERKGRRRA